MKMCILEIRITRFFKCTKKKKKKKRKRLAVKMIIILNYSGDYNQFKLGWYGKENITLT